MATTTKERFLLENACAYRFGSYSGRLNSGTTMAETAKKAKANFIARAKAAFGLDFSTNLAIEGTLKNLDTDECYEIVLYDDGYKCEVKKVVRN